MYHGLKQELAGEKPPAVAFAEGRWSVDILQPELDDHYNADFSSEAWPPVTLWVPKAEKAPR